MHLDTQRRWKKRATLTYRDDGAVLVQIEHLADDGRIVGPIETYWRDIDARISTGNPLTCRQIGDPSAELAVSPHTSGALLIEERRTGTHLITAYTTEHMGSDTRPSWHGEISDPVVIAALIAAWLHDPRCRPQPYAPDGTSIRTTAQLPLGCGCAINVVSGERAARCKAHPVRKLITVAA